MLGVGAGGPIAADTAPAGHSVPASAHDRLVLLATPEERAAERDAWAVLTAVDGLGPVAFSSLLAWFGSGRVILASALESGGIARLAATPAVEPRRDGALRRPVADALAAAIASAAEAAPATLRRLRELDITVVTTIEPAYPRRLTRIAMPPHVLFVRGDVGALDRGRSVAVVGTRRATTAGRTTAGRIATALVAADATVISGLAYGIDGAAHEATLGAGGTTVAVIGGGHAVAVPSGHDRLAARIIASGGAIVSELPPDIEPTKGTFPRRNRIISGLADATIVVEAPPRSGALITASWALEQGRHCFLVPGPIDSPASAGCLGFLREFAGEARIVSGIPQLIADLGMAGPPGAGRSERLVGATLQDLGRTEALVAGELVRGRVTVDELVAVTDLPVATVLAALGLLERRGLVVGVHGRHRPAGALLGERPSRVRR